MSINTLMCFFVGAGALIMIFRNNGSKIAQFLAFIMVVLATGEYLHLTETLRLKLGEGNTMITLAGALIVLALICYIRLKEKSMAMLIATAASIQFLIAIDFIRVL